MTDAPRFTTAAQALRISQRNLRLSWSRSRQTELAGMPRAAEPSRLPRLLVLLLAATAAAALVLPTLLSPWPLIAGGAIIAAMRHLLPNA